VEFTVSDENYVTLNDGTSREILLDEIYLMTNSRKLVKLLRENIGEDYILFRTKSKYDSHKRLVLTHAEFQKGHYYYNLKTSKRFKCVGYDTITGEAMLRQQNGSKNKLKYSTKVEEWAILS
jgi:hypothetical protein